MKRVFFMTLALISLLTYVTVSSFSLVYKIPKDGYIVESDDVYASLTEHTKLDFSEVSQDDTIFQRAGRLYLNKTSFKYSEDYPLILKNQEVISFFNESAILIARDFYQNTSFENMYLASGISFNEDFSQADPEEYILARLSDGTYMNAQLVKVETSFEKHYISNSSFIYFGQDQIIYETIKDNKISKKTIDNLLGATISLGQNQFSYAEFFEYLKTSEIDPGFVIEDEKIGIDPTMPTVKPNQVGGAELTFDENGNVVINADTVEIKDLDENKTTGEAESDKKGGADGAGGNQGNNNGGQNGAGTEGEQGDLNDGQGGNELPGNENGGNNTLLPGEDGETSIEDEDNSGEEAPGGGTTEDEISKEPSVTVGEFEPWVYSAGGSIKIYDFSSRIIGSVKIAAVDETGKTVARKSLSNSGEVVLSVLPPDTNLTIKTSYRYYNNNGEKVETGKNGIPALPTQEIKTLSLDEFVPVQASVSEPSDILPRSIKFDDITLKNRDTVDTSASLFEKSKVNSLGYISSGELIATPVDSSKSTKVISIPANTISKLKLGNSVEYTTSSNMESDTEYRYEFKFYDKFGNRIITNPETINGSARTCKVSPKMYFDLKKNEAGDVTFNLNLQDVDNSLIPLENGKYRIKIKTETGVYAVIRAEVSGENDNGTKSGETISLSDNNVDISFVNLPFNKYLTMEVIADVDINDGQGLQHDVVIGTYSFFTSGITSGNISFNTIISSVGGTYATVTTSVSSLSSSKLLQLATDIKFTLTANGSDEVIEFNLNKDDLSNMSFDNNNLVYDNDGCVIVEGDTDNKIPRLKLRGNIELFNENAWQALLSGGYSQSDFCTLYIDYLQGTLSPSTSYKLQIQAMIDQGLSFYNIETINRTDSFATLKREPEVHYDKVTMINNTIQFDNLYITDIDETVIKGPISIELLWNGIIVDSQTIEIGIENKIDTLLFKDLMNDESYVIRYKAPEYNNGLTQITFTRNYIFNTYEFKSNTSITGKLNITELLRTPTTVFEENDVEKYNLEDNLIKYNGDENDNIHPGYYLKSRGASVESSTHFYSDYIEIDPHKEKTFFFYKFAGESWYGNNPDDTYHSGRQTFYLLLYSYDPVKDTYVWKSEKTFVGAGDYIDLNTITNINVNDITHIRVSGISGFEDSAMILQGITPEEIVDLSQYSEYYQEGTLLNGAGELTVNASYTVIDYPIQVKPGEIYYTSIDSYFQNVAFYDENGRFLVTNRYYNGSGYLDYGGFDGNLIVVPNKAYSMKVSLHNTALNNDKYYIKKLFTSKDEYYATVDVEIKDNKNALPLNSEYVLSVYVNSNNLNQEGSLELVETRTFPIKASLNDKEWYSIHDYNLGLNKLYSFKLQLKIGNTLYFLDQINMQTETDWEYIYNFTDLDKIYTNEFGKYKVMADITVPQDTVSNYRPVIQGVLDFNGHKFIMKDNYWGFDIGPSGIIKNAVVEYSYPGKDTITNYNSFVHGNNGILKDIIVNVNIPLIYEATGNLSFLVYSNGAKGLVENCAVQFNDNITLRHKNTTGNYVASGICCYNYGTIRDCYVAFTREDKQLYIDNNLENSARIFFGGIVSQNWYTGIVENCFSIMNINQRQGTGYSSFAGTISRENYDKITNCFSVGERNTYIMLQGSMEQSNQCTNEFIPAVAHNTPDSNNNCYSFTDPRVDYSAANYAGYIKEDPVNLQSKDWYRDVFGMTDDRYIIDNCLDSGYYPRLKFNSNMMKYQSYIPITSYLNYNKNLRVMDANVISQGRTSAEAYINIYNPTNMIIQNVEVENLECNISEIVYNGDTFITTVKVSLSMPQKYVSSYKIKSIGYQSGNAVLPLTTEVSIPCEFYKEISTTEDWLTVISDPSQNYHLSNDINFQYVTDENKIRVSKAFSGKLDGTVYDLYGNPTNDNYELKNINLTKYSYVIYSLTGTISNLDVNNLRINANATRNEITGFIRYASTKKSLIDNVHVMNSEIYAYYQTGGVLGSASYATVQNCSTTNTKIYDYKPNNDNYETYVGGVCGYIYRGNIRNCFVSDIEINISKVKKSYGVGGIVGQAVYSKIKNVYTEGSASNYSNNLGGIAGYINYCNINNAYTKMRLEGSDVIGGISGYDANIDIANKRSNSEFKNLLSLSDIVVKSSSYYEVHRLFGRNNKFGLNLYGTKEQKITPVPLEVVADEGERVEQAFTRYIDDTEGLLDALELGTKDVYKYQVGLGDEFNYDKLNRRSLPVLTFTDSDEIIPHQKDIYLPLEGVDISYLDSDKITQNGVTYYKATFQVRHPLGYTINPSTAVVSNMITYTTDTDSKGYDFIPGDTVDYITIRTQLEKALDNYSFSVDLVSKTSGSSYSQNLSVQFEYSVGPLYWEIPNYDIWKSVMKKHGYTNENFKITGDIDFNAKTVDTNLLVNRIEGIPTAGINPTIKNINIVTNLSSGYLFLFSNIMTKMDNINFDNVRADLSYANVNNDRVGIIAQANNMTNVSFNNITVILPNRCISYAGVIGELNGNGYNVDFSNIVIDRVDYVTNDINYVGCIGVLGGGLVYSDFDNITITANLERSARIGAAIGYFRANSLNFKGVEYEDEKHAGDPDYTPAYSINVNNTNVTGYNRVGGAIGEGSYNRLGTLTRQLKNAIVQNVTVRGMLYVGGYSGLYNPTQDELQISNTHVYGNNYVGGVFGSGNNTIYDVDAHDLQVSGGYCVGAYSGAGSGSAYRVQLYDSEVTGGLCVGGLTGRTNGYHIIYDAVIDNIEINGVDESLLPSDLKLDYTQAKTDGFPTYERDNQEKTPYVYDGSYVGGICGHNSSASYTETLINSQMTNVSISGNNYVGGLYGAAKAYYCERSSFDVVTQGNEYVGGIFGYVYLGNTGHKYIRQDYIRNTVEGNNYIGGVAGFTEKCGIFTNGDNHNGSYSVILDLSLEGTTGNPSIDYFANVYDINSNSPGAIDQLRYTDTTKMKAGSSASFEKISQSTLPVLYAQEKPTVLNKYQPKIIASEDILDFYDMFGNRIYNDELNFNYNYWNYNEDLILYDNPYELTKTAAGNFEISGLKPNTSYTITASYEERESSDQGLLLYYDAKNNTGTGSVDTSSTVWKNLGSLGSDYDMNIRMVNTKVNNSDRYQWKDNSLYLKTNKEYTDDFGTYYSGYNDVMLETDHENGSLEWTDSQEYTISITLNRMNRSYGHDLFGTYIQTSNINGIIDNMGPHIYFSIDKDVTTVLGGRWGNSWTYVNQTYGENDSRYLHVGKPITLTLKYERETKGTYYLRLFVNGVMVKETSYGPNLGGNATYETDKKTDGWVHMLGRPTVKFDGENYTITNSIMNYCGNIYSVRYYDRALEDKEIMQLYNDDFSYYGLNNNSNSAVVKQTLSKTSNANGVIVLDSNSISDISSINTLGNVKFKLVETGTYGNEELSQVLSTDSSTGKISSLYHVVPNANTVTVEAFATKTDMDANNKLNGYYFENDSIWLSTIASATWYRSTTNSYDGVEVARGTNNLYVGMRGYYYAKVGNSFTPIVHLNSPITFMQLYSVSKTTEILEKSELRDDAGNWNPVNDILVNGGIKMKEFISASSASLMSIFHMDVDIQSDELPLAYVYSSGVDTVNIDFSSKPENLNVKITAEGQTVLDTVVSQQTLTFGYDYKTPFMITWSDGVHTSYLSVDAIDVRNSISTYGDNYYYLTNNGISSNIGDFNTMASHIYKNEVITYQNEIVNIDTLEVRGTNRLWNVVDTRPLFTFDYEGDVLKTYYAYSTYGDLCIEQQAIIENNEYYGLDPNMSNRAKGFIIDEYQNKTFVSSIYEDELINWYHNIKTPEEFSNMDIREITCSIESNIPVVLIRYYNGSLIGFDYTTGEQLELFSEIEYGFLDYVASTFSSMFKVSRSSALQGSYEIAVSNISALDISENADVIELFSLAPVSDKEGGSDGPGFSIHDTKVKLVFDTENEEFVIAKSEGHNLVGGNGVSDGHANGNGTGQGNKKEKVDRELQDEIDELAAKNNIPGLSSGIVGNTGIVNNSFSVIKTVFVSIMLICATVSIGIIFIKFKRGRI